jgi:hypothetical protein
LGLRSSSRWVQPSRLHVQIVAELERPRERDLARAICSLAASKDTGEEEAETGEIADAGDTAAHDSMHVLTEEGCDVLEYIPVDSAAAAPSSTGRPPARRDHPRLGFRISKGFISPLDLVQSGCCRAGPAGG